MPVDLSLTLFLLSVCCPFLSHSVSMCVFGCGGREAVPKAKAKKNQMVIFTATLLPPTHTFLCPFPDLLVCMWECVAVAGLLFYAVPFSAVPDLFVLCCSVPRVSV